MTSSFTDDLKIPIPPEVRTTRKVLKLARERPDIVEKMTIEALKYTSRVRFGKEIGSHSFMKAEAKKMVKITQERPDLVERFWGKNTDDPMYPF